MGLKAFFCALCLMMATGSLAFVVQPSVSHAAISSRLAGMAQPETEIKTKTKVETQVKQKVVIQKKEKVHDPLSRREEEFQDAPMFKVMLLEDDSYSAEHVVTRLCSIIEDLDEDAASTVFQQAMQTGKAMCGKYPFERAELFKEQLLRSTPMIFADIEDENA
jgi:ATP-dependent Clp protease adapter protein ClpS